MTRDRTSWPYPSALSAFWYLIRFPGLYEVKMAAVLAILLCVVYSMGLGGLVLWISESAASFLGSEWSPDALSPLVRATLGVTWVAFFTFVFMNMLLSILLRKPHVRSWLQLLRSHRKFSDAQVTAAVNEWLSGQVDAR